VSAAVAAERWFGDFEIKTGQRAHWQVGPLALTVEHAANEWRICHSRSDDIWAASASVRVEQATPCEEQSVDRYIVDDAHPLFSLLPLLPDRPVITRPVSPVFVPAGEAVRLYVTMPVWLQLAVGADRKVLAEIPVQRLSDTWFGPNTCEGELCYALRSRCRLSLSEDAFVPHRVVTPLRIRNRSTELMVLERVNVPVRQLSLYAEPSGRLWTGELALERTEDGRFASVDIEIGAPPEARGASPLAGPREPAPKKTVIRAFSALFQ
jgi:hypothetical protein